MITTYGRRGAVPARKGGSVVSIGVFDGVHRGHQAILAANVARAARMGARPSVITFRTHPKGLLLGRAPRTLTTLEHRLELFARAGIEHALVLDFDAELRALSAESFVDEIAVRRLDARAFVLGFDSKFGHDRSGSPESLRAAGFDVEVVPKVLVGGWGVSSTVIREAVELGDLDRAAAMLGRRVSVFGEVVHGSALGHTIGFPTANLDLHHELHPPPGVYACRVRRQLPDLSTRVHDAVANIGFRPTVEAVKRELPLVEVHLLDFEGDLYGQRFELEFLAALRGEQRFAGLEALAEQIRRDVAAARAVLAQSPLEAEPAALARTASRGASDG